MKLGPGGGSRVQEMSSTICAGDQMTHGGQKGFGMTKHGRSGHATRSPRFRFLQKLEAQKECSQGPLSDQGPETVRRGAIPSAESNMRPDEPSALAAFDLLEM